MKKFNCQSCGKETKTKLSEYKGSRNHFCSKKCYGKFITKTKKGIHLTPMTLTYCERCKKEIKNYGTKRRRFCSFICTIKRKIVTCENCGKPFSKKENLINRSIHNYCSKKCYGEHRQGKNNIMWKGGISFEPYSPLFNDTLKKQIRDRDYHICQMCGIDENATFRKLDIHHIDYDKQNNNQENLIALCINCHGKVHFDRDDWKIYFKSRKFTGEK
jgi:hypothetical protein